MVKTNFTEYQGTTFVKTLSFKDDSGDPINISGFNYRGQIRTKDSHRNLVASFTCTKLDDYRVEVRLEASTTSGIIAGTYVYDVEQYTVNDAYVTKPLVGEITFLAEVTM